jgi:S1-C subfamily serine protease
LRVVPQLIEKGQVEQVGLGVRIDVEQRLERRTGLRGVLVLAVEPGSPAEKAGLRGIERTPRGIVLGDLIVGIDGAAIADYDDFYNALDPHQAGDRVKVKVQRADRVVEVEVPLVVVQ